MANGDTEEAEKLSKVFASGGDIKLDTEGKRFMLGVAVDVDQAIGFGGYSSTD